MNSIVTTGNIDITALVEAVLHATHRIGKRLSISLFDAETCDLKKNFIHSLHFLQKIFDKTFQNKQYG